jgi:DNA-binding SARP family transcriptional activator
VEFRVLGPLEVSRDGELLELGAPKQKALLGFLLLHANEAVSTDRLAEAIWADEIPKSAVKAIQVYVSSLRTAFGDARDALETRGPGYGMRVGPGELDLREFEGLVARAEREEPAVRIETLRQALALWRGPPLAEFAYEAFVQPEASRLEELRRHAVEERLAAALALGQGAELIAELQALVADRPLEERPRALLMRALYRAGRQSDALELFREGRRLLSDELGLEPGPELVELERAILRHDPSLAASTASDALRSILVIPETHAAWETVLPLAEALARRPIRREVVAARVVPATELGAEMHALDSARRELTARGTTVRVAAFSSHEPGTDVARLGERGETDLLLLATDGDPFGGPYASVFALATCDVAALVTSGGPAGDGPVVVPFGAFEHDWAALELGAWAATALERPLRLIGATDSGARGRDASRLLADASLIVQHSIGVVAEPVLGEPGSDGVGALAAAAGLLVVGLSERWRSEGLGRTRTMLLESRAAPTMLVRGGVRPSGIAPSTTLTCFTWSIEQSRL